MCRITEHENGYPHFHHHNRVNRRLKLTNFSLNLSLAAISSSAFLPEILTLVFLPRVHGTRLEINGSKIRPDSPSFLSLHRIYSPEFEFSCTDHIVVPEGAAFEVHVGDLRLLRGVFSENEENEWRMECKCVVENREFPGLNRIEVCVRRNGGVMMRQNVAPEKWKSNKRNSNGFRTGLDAIPEGIEDGVAEENEAEDEAEGEAEAEAEAEMTEGARWAVDVGIWVACFGVVFLASSASATSFFRRNLLVRLWINSC